MYLEKTGNKNLLPSIINGEIPIINPKIPLCNKETLKQLKKKNYFTNSSVSSTSSKLTLQIKLFIL